MCAWRSVHGSTVSRDGWYILVWRDRIQRSPLCRLKHRWVQWLGVSVSYVTCRVYGVSMCQHQETLDSTTLVTTGLENWCGGSCNRTDTLTFARTIRTIVLIQNPPPKGLRLDCNHQETWRNEHTLLSVLHTVMSDFLSPVSQVHHGDFPFQKVTLGVLGRWASVFVVVIESTRWYVQNSHRLNVSLGSMFPFYFHWDNGSCVPSLCFCVWNQVNTTVVCRGTRETRQL